MKISKLIRLLQKYPPNTDVLVSSDMEGNNFSYMNDVSGPAYYVHHVEKYPEYDIQGEIELYDEEDLGELPKNVKPKKCVVLWPR